MGSLSKKTGHTQKESSEQSMKRQRIPDRVITNSIQQQEIIKVTEGQNKNNL